MLWKGSRTTSSYNCAEGAGNGNGSASGHGLDYVVIPAESEVCKVENEDVYDIEHDCGFRGESRTLSEKPKSVKVTIESYGDVLAVEKTFSTGSRGFYGAGKIEIAGKRYQIGVNIVEIGSKPDTKAASKAS